MTQPIYTASQLEAKTIAQLKRLASARFLKPTGNKSYKQTWIDTILAAQPVQVEEPKATCATCPHFQSFNEVSGRGCCQLFPHLVVREHHARTSDCDRVAETFEGNNEQVNINSAAQDELTIDEQRFLHPEAQEELNTYIEQQAEEIAPEQPEQLTVHEALEAVLCVTSGFKFGQEERGGTTYWYGRLGKFHTGFYHSKKETTHIAAKYIGSPLHKRHQAGELTAISNEVLTETCLSEEIVTREIPSETREQRAERIEVLQQHEGLTFTVRNIDNGNHYVVRPAHEDPKQRCECGDVYFRGVRCKHQIAVENWIEMQSLKHGWTDVHSTNKDIAVCPDCGGMGCSNCGYRGSRHTDLCQPTSNYRLSLFSYKEGMKSFQAWDGEVNLGLVFQVRNPNQPVENVVDSYYWLAGADTHRHMSLLGCLLFAQLQVTGLTKSQELSPEELLDKPFDELSREEWERLKEYEPIDELMAA
jgi:hypothetical protein